MGGVGKVGRAVPCPPHDSSATFISANARRRAHGVGAFSANLLLRERLKRV
jgi:hypothetical protein